MFFRNREVNEGYVFLKNSKSYLLVELQEIVILQVRKWQNDSNFLRFNLVVCLELIGFVWYKSEWI